MDLRHLHLLNQPGLGGTGVRSEGGAELESDTPPTRDQYNKILHRMTEGHKKEIASLVSSHKSREAAFVATIATLKGSSPATPDGASAGLKTKLATPDKTVSDLKTRLAASDKTVSDLKTRLADTELKHEAQWAEAKTLCNKRIHEAEQRSNQATELLNQMHVKNEGGYTAIHMREVQALSRDCAKMLQNVDGLLKFVCSRHPGDSELASELQDSRLKISRFVDGLLAR